MHITKWGNSLGVRIPRALAKNAGMADGTPVKISVRKGTIILEAVPYPLQDLLAKIDDDNLHGETSTGKPQGHEIW